MKYAKSRQKKLSISLLVSNRIDTIRKCMESLKPLLEGIDSELIAVDTVGEKTDGSIDIVKEYTDKIVSFTWCNDFAAARNAGLSLATGEWFMFIDDDEWFDDCSEIVRFFQTGEDKKHASAFYTIRNYTDYEGNYSECYVGRMVKRDKNTRFVGSVHEIMTTPFARPKYFSAYIHHYGYAFRTIEERMKHAARNRGLLEEEVRKNPKDMRLCSQLAQEMALSRYENHEGIAYCNKVMEENKDQENNVCFQFIIVILFEIYETMNTTYEEKAAEMKRILHNYQLLKPTQAALLFLVGKQASTEGKYKEAISYLSVYLKLYGEVQENIDIYRDRMVADLIKFLQPVTYRYATLYMAHAYGNLGKYEESFDWYQKLPWEEEDYDPANAVWTLFQVMNKSMEGLHNLELFMQQYQHSEKLRSLMLTASLRFGVTPAEWMYQMSTEEIKASMNLYPELIEKFREFINEIKRRNSKEVIGNKEIELTALKRELLENMSLLREQGKNEDVNVLIQEAIKMGLWDEKMQEAFTSGNRMN